MMQCNWRKSDSRRRIYGSGACRALATQIQYFLLKGRSGFGRAAMACLGHGAACKQRRERAPCTSRQTVQRKAAGSARSGRRSVLLLLDEMSSTAYWTLHCFEICVTTERSSQNSTPRRLSLCLKPYAHTKSKFKRLAARGRLLSAVQPYAYSPPPPIASARTECGSVIPPPSPNTDL